MSDEKCRDLPEENRPNPEQEDVSGLQNGEFPGEDWLTKNLAAMAQDVPPLPEETASAWRRELEAHSMDKQIPNNPDHPECMEAPEGAVQEQGKEQTRTPQQQREPQTQVFPGKNPRRPNWRRGLPVAAAVVLLIAGVNVFFGRQEKKLKKTAAYGSSARYEAEEAEYLAYEAPAMAMDDMAAESMAMNSTGAAAPSMGMRAAGSQETVPENGTKIVRTVSLSLATRTFDEAVALLDARTKELGGFFSSRSVSSSGSLRRAECTLRIPAEHLDEFLGSAGEIGRVLRQDETAEDMTESYHDTQMELETQKALMERLRQLVTSAASLTEILELESQIANTQYSIDRLQGRLNAVDRKVAYSTVNVTLKEEKEAQAAVDTNRSLLSRMEDAFVGGVQSVGEFLQELLVTLVSMVPAILAAGAGILVIVLLIRHRRKKKQQKP